MKKIADWSEPKRCVDPAHEPPAHIVLEPGVYEHTCPRCGARRIVVVQPPPSFVSSGTG